MSIRTYTILDELCLHFDQFLRALTNNPVSTGQKYPAEKIEEQPLDDSERRHAAALMRINHAGEICAQALYHGQGVAANSQKIKDKMKQAALEEGDHLNWCHRRILELGSHTSYLSLFWYTGSYAIGFCMGKFGEGYNLGFVAETERQVAEHLKKHLKLLPKEDKRSSAILKQMEIDELKHRHDAISLGAATLPEFVKVTMSFTSKIMVKSA